MEKVYEATDEDKERLRKPRGEVVEGRELAERVQEEDFHRLIAVGDRVSLDLHRWGVEPDVAVVDGKIQREEIPPQRLEGISVDFTVNVTNPAGTVTGEAWQSTREAVARRCSSLIRVSGEEDLLALPAITFASPESLVVYGQRDLGAVVLRPRRNLKEFVDGLVGYRTHDHVIVGGSWDQLHCGHRSLLLEAFARGERVDIGVTSEDFPGTDVGVEDFHARKSGIEEFLEGFGLSERANILEIDDYRGNAVEEGEALMVTGETIENARRINSEREEREREPLELMQVPLVDAEDGKPVSSSRIREGVIDRDGRDIT